MCVGFNGVDLAINPKSPQSAAAYYSVKSREVTARGDICWRWWC